MKTFKEFLLMENPISNRKPKWDGKENLYTLGNKTISYNGEGLEELPFDFSSFDLSDTNFILKKNKLTSLKGSPKSCKSFSCQENNLKNLVGAPNVVKEEFDCSYNQKLTSLEGLPKEIGGDLLIVFCPELFEVSPILNCKIEGTIFCGQDNRTVAGILNKYKNNPRNLIKMLAELKQIDKRYC